MQVAAAGPQARLTTGEGDVGDAAGGAHRLNAEALLQALQPVPEGLAAAKDDRHHRDVQVIDQVGGEELADRGRATADADVEAARCLLAAAGASAGLASMKWKVVPPFISIEGLT